MEVFTTGERLLIYRRRKGLTQQQLADICGISVAELNDYENDVSTMSTEVATNIAMQLDVLPNVLLYGF